MVIRAIIQNGSIQPLDPLPAVWQEGQEVVVSLLQAHGTTEAADGERAEAWYRDCMAISGLPWEADELRRFNEAIAELRRQDKEHVARQMELP
jgi:hypothetical protein